MYYVRFYYANAVQKSYFLTSFTIKFDVFYTCLQTLMSINISKRSSKQNDYVPYNQSSSKGHILLFSNNYVVFFLLIMFSVNSSVFESI